MKIAFDYQGTLDDHPLLAAMATTLKASGWDVWIISAMPVNRPHEREQAIESSGLGLPYRVVYHELDNYHVAAAQKKIELMRELGIEWLVDDNEEVVKTVRAAGLKALQL